MVETNLQEELKVGIIRYLPILLKEAVSIENDAENYHGEKFNTKYAYLKNEICIDNKIYTVVFDIRKSAQKNKFWMHRVIIKKRETDYVERITNHT